MCQSGLCRFGICIVEVCRAGLCRDRVCSTDRVDAEWIEMESQGLKVSRSTRRVNGSTGKAAARGSMCKGTDQIEGKRYYEEDSTARQC